MSRYKDITNSKYNRLLAIQYCYTGKNRHAVWLWLCDCGNKIERTANTVKTGLTKSCGCLNNELIESKVYLNFNGRKHTSESKQKISNKKKGKPRSKESIRKGADKLIGRKYSLEHRNALKKGWTEEARLKQANLHSGINCKFYKDGKWKERATEREIATASNEYKNWRVSVFKRDDYTCQLCNKKGVKLNADHIEPWAINKDKRYDINNGRTLCVECHRKTDTFGGRTRAKLQSVGLLT